MAFQKLFQNNRYQSSYVKFIADTAEDVKNIKVGPAQMGCEVYVIDTQKQYVLDSKCVWHSHTGDDVLR